MCFLCAFPCLGSGRLASAVQRGLEDELQDRNTLKHHVLPSRRLQARSPNNSIASSAPISPQTSQPLPQPPSPTSTSTPTPTPTTIPTQLPWEDDHHCSNTFYWSFPSETPPTQPSRTSLQRRRLPQESFGMPHSSDERPTRTDRAAHKYMPREPSPLPQASQASSSSEEEEEEEEEEDLDRILEESRNQVERLWREADARFDADLWTTSTTPGRPGRLIELVNASPASAASLPSSQTSFEAGEEEEEESREGRGRLDYRRKVYFEQYQPRRQIRLPRTVRPRIHSLHRCELSRIYQRGPRQFKFRLPHTLLPTAEPRDCNAFVSKFVKSLTGTGHVARSL